MIYNNSANFVSVSFALTISEALSRYLVQFLTRCFFPARVADSSVKRLLVRLEQAPAGLNMLATRTMFLL